MTTVILAFALGIAIGVPMGVLVERRRFRRSQAANDHTTVDEPVVAKRSEGPFTLQLWRDDGSNLWVFDDPARGLVREPFLDQATAVLDKLIARKFNLEHADRVNLLVSDESFEGAQDNYWLMGAGQVDVTARLPFPATGDGFTYYSPTDGQSFWLCPNLSRYFADPPMTLHVGLDSVHEGGQI